MPTNAERTITVFTTSELTKEEKAITEKEIEEYLRQRAERKEIKSMICVRCGRDINAIGQDNCSTTPGRPLCEDCASE